MAKQSLTKWAYEQLWLKSFHGSQYYETRSNDDGSWSLKTFGSQWETPSTVTIKDGHRCCCSYRIAFLHQCCHEYAIDKKLRIDKYDERWMQDHCYSGYSTPGAKDSVQKVVDSEHLSELGFDKQVHIDEDGGTGNLFDNEEDVDDVDDFTRERHLFNDIESSIPEEEDVPHDVAYLPSIQQTDINTINAPDTSYHDIRQAASDLVEASKNNATHRRYVLYFLKNMTSLLRTGNTMEIESRMRTHLLPAMDSLFGTKRNTPTERDSSIPSTEQSSVAQPMNYSPLKACPLQGGPTNTGRIKSSMEGSKRRVKRKRPNTITAATSMGTQQGSHPSTNPIQFTGSKKSCSFCKRPGHTVVKCPVLEPFPRGLVTSVEERTELAREIHNPAFYVTETAPFVDDRKTNVNNSIPKGSGCLIIHHRYIIKDPLHVNVPPIMHVECTVLDSSKFPMPDYIKVLFTPNAIMTYVSGGKKYLVSELKKAAAR